jgi:hypothetical protein
MRPSPAGSGIGAFSLSSWVTMDGLWIGTNETVLVIFGGADGFGGFSIVGLLVLTPDRYIMPITELRVRPKCAPIQRHDTPLAYIAKAVCLSSSVHGV